ncbi:MAG TPA: hypothetical protein EYP69_06195 [Bacteroidales bacterium]|nr:hypothetical protein [Bacteroidales bacterium]
MKKNNIKFLGFLIFIIYLFSGCENVFHSKPSEGIIHYNLEYLQSEEENPIVSLLPTEMDIEFKNNFTHQKVEGWMGIFYMGGIFNPKAYRKTALLKIMGQKYQYFEDADKQVDFGFDPYDGMKLEETKETKIIAGMLCKKVKVIFPDTSENFDIYYTNEIEIKNANWNNPFHSINGVLLDYQIKMFGIKTHIIATSIEFVEVPDETFSIPDGYKEVSKEEMEEVINKLM